MKSIYEMIKLQDFIKHLQRIDYSSIKYLQLGNSVNPLMHNVQIWSDTL